MTCRYSRASLAFLLFFPPLFAHHSQPHLPLETQPYNLSKLIGSIRISVLLISFRCSWPFEPLSVSCLDPCQSPARITQYVSHMGPVDFLSPWLIFPVKTTLWSLLHPLLSRDPWATRKHAIPVCWHVFWPSTDRGISGCELPSERQSISFYVMILRSNCDSF